MRNLMAISTALILLQAQPAVEAQAAEGRLMRYPDIHGESVVFTYEDDIWSASIKGGSAMRLTSHPGIENHASYSPDGGLIAFTGSYDGGYDVYVIPSTGGEPKRLTYHPAFDRVVGWTNDGEHVLFASRRELYTKLYRVPVVGGPPLMLELDRVYYASISPDGERAAINRFGSDRMNWKGYRGGRQQDIWIADIKGGKFSKITSWEGYDNRPMWHGDQIYFNSDRLDGRMNLYVYDVKSGRFDRCTMHEDWDVEFPSAGKDRIVYGCGGYLWVYDMLADASERLSIEIPSDRWRTRDMYIMPGGYLQEIGLGGDGRRCAAQARGDIYILDTEKERAFNLTRTPGSRELHPALSPSSDSVAFFSDISGEYDLYISETEQGSEWVRIPTGLKTYFYHIEWSPDGRKLLFGDKDLRIFVADIESGEVVEIDRCLFQKDNELFWEVSDYTWAPDSRWVAYSKTDRNLNSSIFLHDLEAGRSHRVTNDRYDDYSPCFGTEGRNLYFLSLRNFTPALDCFGDNNINTDMSRVMVMQLRSGERPPFGDREEEETYSAGASSSDSIVIDLEGIGDRIFTVPIPAGTYRMLSAAAGRIAYLSRESFGFPGFAEFLYPKSVTHYDLHLYDLKDEKDRIIISGIGYYTLSGDGSRAGYMCAADAGVIGTDKAASVGEGFLKWGGLSQRIDVFEEYPQIYRDVWRQIRDFFYDPDMHGKDWEPMYDKYEELIPHVATRADMNYVIGHLIGELTASHEYIIDRGGPPRTYYPRTNVGLLGADLEPDTGSGLYRFERILRGSSWDEASRNPLRAPHIELNEGDYLLEIDGYGVEAGENYLKYLESRAGEKIEITVSSTPDSSLSRAYTIEPLYSEEQLRYHDLVEGNYEYVQRRTGGRVGYMHLADMLNNGLEQFEQAFRAERYRNGLIIDVRGNGGGFVSWFIIDKLERRLEYLTVTRDFEPMRYPHGAHAGPIVLICNEGTASDGEVFTQHFKDLGLGTVIGRPTWGGLIGIINIIPLTDGGLVTQSNVGFANLNREWIVENRGAVPDILVENDPAEVIRGRDSQLDMAIKLIMRELEEEPPAPLTPPDFPRK